MKLYKFIENGLPNRIALVESQFGEGLPESSAGWTQAGSIDVREEQTGRAPMSDAEIVDLIKRDGKVVWPQK